MTTETTGAPEGQTPANTPVAGAPAAPAAPAPVIDPKLSGEPAAEPAAAVPAAPAAEPAGEPTVVTYDTTGDAALDVALSFVGNLGIGPEHPAMKATATGDFGLIKAHLATMGDKARGWEQMVALAEQAYTRAETAKSELQQKVSGAVVAVAGSQENWDRIKAWASTEATPDEKREINAMFDAGPVQARAAAQLLLNAYTKAHGTTLEPKSALRSGASGEAPITTGPLDSRAYAAEVRKLHQKLGNRMEQSAEYAALRARLR